jgi:HEAT repeat protein
MVIAIAGATWLLGALAGADDMPWNSSSETPQLKAARESVDRFRVGQPFGGDVQSFISAGQPDSGALGVFGQALDREPEAARAQVARVLVTLGRQVDPLRASGGHLIRSARIVRLLAEKCLAGVGPARDTCVDALQTSVPSELLRDYGAALTRSLEQAPDDTMFLLVAKAKPAAALPLVRGFARSPRWATNDNVQIALAALGEKAAENKFIQPFLATRDPSQKAKLAASLGYIGTEATLHALASQMRSDLMIEMPRVSLRSVRLDIVAALSYNFPDLVFLWDNAITDDKGYVRVEQFCEKAFGTIWDRPRPPFLTIQGFPSG